MAAKELKQVWNNAYVVAITIETIVVAILEH